MNLPSYSFRTRPAAARPSLARGQLHAARAWSCMLLLLAAWTVIGPLRVIHSAESSQKKEDADERRLRNELKQRDEQIRQLKKAVEEREAEVKKLQQELISLRKRPMVPTDNIALQPYDTHQLFAKDQPPDAGPVVFQFKNGATLLLVWKHSFGKGESGTSTKWEYATMRLTAESNTRELRVNLHKGDWSVYRSNPKAGYLHIGDLHVGDQTVEVSIPDAD